MSQKQKRKRQNSSFKQSSKQSSAANDLKTPPLSQSRTQSEQELIQNLNPDINKLIGVPSQPTQKHSNIKKFEIKRNELEKKREEIKDAQAQLQKELQPVVAPQEIQNFVPPMMPLFQWSPEPISKDDKIEIKDLPKVYSVFHNIDQYLKFCQKEFMCGQITSYSQLEMKIESIITMAKKTISERKIFVSNIPEMPLDLKIETKKAEIMTQTVPIKVDQAVQEKQSKPQIKQEAKSEKIARNTQAPIQSNKIVSEQKPRPQSEKKEDHESIEKDSSSSNSSSSTNSEHSEAPVKNKSYNEESNLPKVNIIGENSLPERIIRQVQQKIDKKALEFSQKEAVVNTNSEENFGYPSYVDFSMNKPEEGENFRKLVPANHELLSYYYPLLKDCQKSSRGGNFAPHFKILLRKHQKCHQCGQPFHLNWIQKHLRGLCHEKATLYQFPVIRTDIFSPIDGKSFRHDVKNKAFGIQQVYQHIVDNFEQNLLKDWGYNLDIIKSQLKDLKEGKGLPTPPSKNLRETVLTQSVRIPKNYESKIKENNDRKVSNFIPIESKVSKPTPDNILQVDSQRESANSKYSSVQSEKQKMDVEQLQLGKNSKKRTSSEMTSSSLSGVKIKNNDIKKIQRQIDNEQEEGELN